MTFSQSFHNAQAMRLMNGARGALMLSEDGDVCTRITTNDTTTGFRDLPFAEHRCGVALAYVTEMGFTLTVCGADWLLENLATECARTTAKLSKIALRQFR